ncbi:GMC family oxidoreductase [Novosphingobium flavum]|uniref:GMC family oxidoreductase n=1 Tax=Novosphingobium aerophilum TaxID=2839843 RepID=A0A7X1F749_9SPHN|nr:GMC family oxidoreductase [Novosphingobium aerophilum]MBC2651608.1 GMC family oxidoreductase [Novosphingobium aerophilum]MBC2661479.1 GMC family oxidoreductase [Novosphingobium aerophilum]
MFDAIVIGSGMSGGMAAKELCERGLKTLVIERGRKLEHGASYTDGLQPWELPNAGSIPEEELARDYPIQRQCYAVNSATQQYWVKDSQHPYDTPADKPFSWIRGYHLGGRSIMWGRQTYRLSEMDLTANARDGHGIDWPIRYADLAPWYDKVESFIGVSGENEGLPQLPDGQFLPAMPMTDGEKLFKAAVERQFAGRRVIMGRCAHLTQAQPQHTELGRAPCQYRSLCERGCSYGAYHSSLSSSLPAAERTGNLTIVTDAIAHSIVTDPATGKATGVRVIDQHTRAATTYQAKVVFLCASTIGTAQILLHSASAAHPRGLANGSDQVGRNLMDHVYGPAVQAIMDGPETYHRGRRPNGIYIPRYRNLDGQTEPYLRGYGFQGRVMRQGWRGVAAAKPAVGAELKDQVRHPGPWVVGLAGFGEMLPNPDNRVTLHPTKTDQWGLPQLVIDCHHGDNDRELGRRMLEDAKAMVLAAGGRIVREIGRLNPPGLGIHEMGTARMGHDPRTSVLNRFNQAHEVPNLFITDGAAMASSGCQNPSLTYMAMSARAAHHAVEFLKAGAI